MADTNPFQQPAPAAQTVNPEGALATVRAMFPFLSDLGISVNQLQDWAVEFAGMPEAVVAKVRDTSQWKSRFAGIRRQDGTLRMTEKDYLTREDDYRQVLKRFGQADHAYNDPNELKGFFDQDIDPNELNERFEMFDTVKRGSADIKDAFYVYAGMKLSDEDLYAAAIDPAKAESLTGEYNSRVAKSPLDYQTWITRATEAGLERVTRTLNDLQKKGVATGDALSKVKKIDPGFARTVADALYRGGTTGAFLNLNELEHAFQYALIGGAAQAQGLALPTADRVESLRQAGVSRAKALEGYGQIATKGTQWNGMLSRAGLDRDGFTQDEFEKAVFLSSAQETDLLQRAEGAEKAFGEAQGAAGFSVDRASGRLQQAGLR